MGTQESREHTCFSSGGPLTLWEWSYPLPGACWDLAFTPIYSQARGAGMDTRGWAYAPDLTSFRVTLKKFVQYSGFVGA